MPALVSFAKGVITRIARHLMPEDSLIDAVNVVPDLLGGIKTRLGHALIATLPANVHSLYTMIDAMGNKVRYAGAANILYRATTPFLTTETSTPWDAENMRGFGEQTVYTFFANGDASLRQKDDGTTLTRWGIEAPQSAPTVAGGALPAGNVAPQLIEGWEYTLGTGLGTNPWDNPITDNSQYVKEGLYATFRQFYGYEDWVNPATYRDFVFIIQGKFTGQASIWGPPPQTYPAPKDLSTISGQPSEDEDEFVFWIYLSRTDIIKGFYVRFIDGAVETPTDVLAFIYHFSQSWYEAFIDNSQLTQQNASWTEIHLPKKLFQKKGSNPEAGAGWSSIKLIEFHFIQAGHQGQTLVYLDDLRLVRPATSQAGQPLGTGALTGKFRYKAVFARKPKAATAIGTTNATHAFTPGALPLTLSGGTTPSGHAIGSSLPVAEIVYYLSVAQSGGTIHAEYWNGAAWVTALTAPTLTATGYAQWKLTFPLANWRLGGYSSDKYWIRVYYSVLPSTAAVATAIAAYDSVVSARSNPGPASAEISVTNQAIALTGIPEPTTPGSADYDTQVTHTELYRTVADQTGDDATYAFETDIPAGKTTYTSNILDAALGAAVELDNHRPAAFTTVAEHQNRLWGASGNIIYPSKPFKPESFPPLSAIEVATTGEPIIRLRQYDGILYAWTRARIYQVIGTSEQNYQTRELRCPTGLGAKFSVSRGDRGILFLGEDGDLWLLRSVGDAVNLSDDPHYPLFHGVSTNGITHMTTDLAIRPLAVSAWFSQRFYLAYASQGAPSPDTIWCIDDRTQSWWRDSRAVRAFHLERSGDVLLAAIGANVVQWDQGTTDAGTAISWSVTTRDLDEGTPESDKTLAQLAVELNSGGANVTVQGIVNWGASQIALGTVVSSALSQQLVTDVALTLYRALGFQLTGAVPVTITRLLPRLIIHPPTLTRFLTIPTDLGWPGPKRIEVLFLDTHLLSGSLSIPLIADGTTVQTLSYSTAGRKQGDILPTTFDATIFELRMTGGLFRLYPDSKLMWLPLPPAVYAFRMVATDLGHPGMKSLTLFELDAEVPGGPATVTIQFLGDNAVLHTLTPSVAATRGRPVRFRLPATANARIIEVSITCPSPVRLWHNTLLHWVGIGPHRERQSYQVVTQFERMQETPLAKLAMRQE